MCPICTMLPPTPPSPQFLLPPFLRPSLSLSPLFPLSLPLPPPHSLPQRETLRSPRGRPRRVPRIGRRHGRARGGVHASERGGRGDGGDAFGGAGGVDAEGARLGRGVPRAARARARDREGDGGEDGCERDSGFRLREGGGHVRADGVGEDQSDAANAEADGTKREQRTTENITSHPVVVCVRLISLLRFSPHLTCSFLPFPSSFASRSRPFSPFRLSASRSRPPSRTLSCP